MTFEEWADRTFGSDFQMEETLTYFRMSAAWENAQNAEREECAVLAESTICDTHIPTGLDIYGTRVAKALRARGKK